MRAIGRRLRPLRAGMAALASAQRWVAAVPATIRVTSLAFGEGEPMPARYTADGVGLSPPLACADLPAGTRSLVLLVEDADAPFPVPAVHAIAYDISPEPATLGEGALPVRLKGRAPEGFAMGRNWLARPGWTPPAPPPGHGPHRYAFQVFALAAAPVFEWPPGRGYLLRRIRPHVIGRGMLTGIYERP